MAGIGSIKIRIVNAEAIERFTEAMEGVRELTEDVPWHKERLERILANLEYAAHSFEVNVG